MSNLEFQNVESTELENKPISSFLNTLTILTLVGCAIGAVSVIYNYFTICTTINNLEEMDIDNLGSGALANMMDSAKELMVKQCENNLALTSANLISIALCAYGALQMRKLKKQGFSIYTIGQFLAPIASVILLGSGASSGLMLLTAMVIPIVFVLLYFTQLKQLTQ